jgi:hypothetical protein
MSQNTISGIVTAIEPNSAGVDTVYVKPLDGSLTNYMTGAPSPRRGGPQIGDKIECLVIPGNIERNFTYIEHQPMDVTALWAGAKPAQNQKPNGEVKPYTDADREASKLKREAFKAQRLAAMLAAESLAEAAAAGETVKALEPTPAA